MTREIIADFLVRSAKSEICERPYQSRKNIFCMFDFYIDHIIASNSPELKLYNYGEDKSYQRNYENRRRLINAILEYGTEQYVKEVLHDGYYCIEFLVDPLRDPDKWKAFITCIRKGTGNDGAD